MSKKFRRRWMGVLATAALLLAFPLSAFAQNCALCYTQRASAGARMIQALRSGILVLIIPPTVGSVGMIFLVRRRSNQFKRDDGGAEPGQDW
jgi:hypothetical protein